MLNTFGLSMIIFVCTFSVRASADLSEWSVDDSARGMVSIAHTYIDSESAQNSVNATFPFFAYSQLHTYFAETQQEYEGGGGVRSQDLSLGVTSDPYAPFNVNLTYEESGKNSSLAYKSTSLTLDLDIGSDMELMLRGLVGDINVYPEGLSQEVFSLLDQYGLLADARAGGGLEFAYHYGDWRWGASYNYYDYEGRPTLTENQRQTIEDAIRRDSQEFALLLWLQGLDGQTTERYRREYILSTLRIFNNAMRSKSILSKQDFSVSGQWVHSRMLYQCSLMRYESYLEDSFHSQYSIGANVQFHENFDSGLRLIYSEETSQFYTELALGFSW